MKIKAIDPNGNQKESQVPPIASIALVEQMIRQLKSAGFTSIELVGEKGPLCPDCGQEMEQDGGYPYCE